MSDFPRPDWWQANNGLWYAPPRTEDGEPPSSEIRTSAEQAAERKKKADDNTGAGCLIVIALVIVVVIAGALMGGDDDGDGGDSGPTEFGAFDVCTQFVRDRLRAPGSASFPNEFQDDGEVRTTRSGDVWTVRSHVDAENAFGGEVRTPFECQVRHVDGDSWSLVDLSMSE